MMENKDIRISPSVIHGDKVIGVDIKKYKQALAKITKLEKGLEYARECNIVKDKYWSQIGIDRNSYLLEKENLERKVEELETELYFCNRNRKMEKMVGSENAISEEKCGL